MRMLQLGHGPCLAHQLLFGQLIVKQARHQKLQGDVTLEFGVLRQIDFTHPAFAEQANDLVVSDGAAFVRPSLRQNLYAEVEGRLFEKFGIGFRSRK